MASPISRTAFRDHRKASEAAAVDDEAARQAAKSDAFVQAFIAKTPQQVLDYVDANVTDLASARALLKRMALMLLLLARKEYRE